MDKQKRVGNMCPRSSAGLALSIIIALLLVMGCAGLVEPSAEEIAAEQKAIATAHEVIAKVLAPEPPVSGCTLGTELVMVPVDEMMDGAKHNYQEMLYKYEGERHIVRLPEYLTPKQAELLIYAYHTAEDDGHDDPTVLQGLIWQESKAGGFPGYEVAGDEFGLRVGKRYYGVGQIKVAAARDVFRRFADEFPKHSTLTDEEVIVKLMTDDKFNIRIASKYLWMMQHNERTDFKRPTNYAITAYNRGLGNTYGTDYNNWHYTVGVHKWRHGIVSEFNKANDIK